MSENSITRKVLSIMLHQIQCNFSQFHQFHIFRIASTKSRSDVEGDSEIKYSEYLLIEIFLQRIFKVLSSLIFSS